MIKEKIESIHARRTSIVVIGSGYVGLPTAALFANAGFHVVAVDNRVDIVHAINCGSVLSRESGLSELVAGNVKNGRLSATENLREALAYADVVIVSVQTPIRRNRKPNLSFLIEVLREIKCRPDGKLTIISSTIPPKTMMGIVKPLFEASGLKADEDFFLAYVPERVSPNNAIKEFVENPRLIGGIGPNSTIIAAELFRTVCKVVIETNAATAEVAKLSENAFRDVNIAFSNQLALICEQVGADVTEVIKLANTHPRVKILMPGAGVGGSCLPKDSFFMMHNTKMASKKNILTTARSINEYMPLHVAQLIEDSKNIIGEARQTKIAVLGTAYKGGVDDTRGSPAEKIIKHLKSLGFNVFSYDPNTKESFGATRANSIEEAIKNANAIIIVTDHPEFITLDLSKVKKIMAYPSIIIDGRRIINPEKAKAHGFLYFGVGYGKIL